MSIQKKKIFSLTENFLTFNSLVQCKLIQYPSLFCLEMCFLKQNYFGQKIFLSHGLRRRRRRRRRIRSRGGGSSSSGITGNTTHCLGNNLAKRKMEKSYFSVFTYFCFATPKPIIFLPRCEWMKYFSLPARADQNCSIIKCSNNSVAPTPFPIRPV